MDATTKTMTQIHVTRRSAAYWRITFDNPPLNVLGPPFVREFRDIIAAVKPTRTSRSSSSTAQSKAFS